MLFTLGALRKIQTGCLLIVSDVVVEGEFKRITDEEMRARRRPDDRARARSRVTDDALAARPSSSSTPRRPTASTGPPLAGARPPGVGARARRGDTLFSERPEHLRELARAGGRGRRRRCVVAVGGDGTVNEVASGIVGIGGVELAVIPRGTGVDFVRTYGIPAKLDAAVEVALRGADARDRRRARRLPRLVGRGRRGLVRQRRRRRDERRGREAHERVVEGARRQGLVPLVDARRLRPLAQHRGARLGRRRDPRGRDARRRRRQRPLPRRRDDARPEAEPDDGLFDVLADRRRHEGATSSARCRRSTAARISPTRRPSCCAAGPSRVDADEPLPIQLDGEQPGTTPVRFEVVPRRCACACRLAAGGRRS